MLRCGLSAGEHHSLALGANGDVFAWGSNAEGQLGSSSTVASAAPVLVAGPSSQHRDAALLQPATAVACGARHSLALNALGQCLAWGWSLHGQCGKSAPSVPMPSVVQSLGPLTCVGVAGGMGHTVVCTDQGDVYAWGLNGDGQLGDGSDVSALEVGFWGSTLQLVWLRVSALHGTPFSIRLAPLLSKHTRPRAAAQAGGGRSAGERERDQGGGRLPPHPAAVRQRQRLCLRLGRVWPAGQRHVCQLPHPAGGGGASWHQGDRHCCRLVAQPHPHRVKERVRPAEAVREQLDLLVLQTPAAG